jgi:hypothetical protein
LATGERAPVVPTAFELSAYPNPFNAQASIRFSLPSESPVSVKLYDVTGREVRTLVEETRAAAGEHSLTIDASNLASGVYIATLRSGTAAQSQKLLLLK